MDFALSIESLAQNHSIFRDAEISLQRNFALDFLFIFVWQKHEKQRKKPCAPPENFKSNYDIGKPLKYYIKNTSFGLDTMFIPKLYLRLLWFFRRTAALFRQIRTFPQLFRFCSDLENPGIRQIVINSMLTGRRWEGRVLINLCGNNNVRNCDLLQIDFFDRCRTVLGVAKGFFWYVVKFGKR